MAHQWCSVSPLTAKPRPRTLRSDLAELRRDGFFADGLRLFGFLLGVAGLLGAAALVVVGMAALTLALSHL